MEAAQLIPRRDPKGHKGTFGRLLVIGGSHGMAGAAYFTALAALRMGVGMVRIATHECNRIIYQTRLPEALLSTYEDYHFEEVIFDALRWADAVVIGPGLSQQSLEREVFTYAYEKALDLGLPMLIDADGLNLLAKKINAGSQDFADHSQNFEDRSQDFVDRGSRSTIFSAATPDLQNPSISHQPSIILTPHLCEMSRLTGIPIDAIASDLSQTASDFADKYGVIVHLKSDRSVTAAPGGTLLQNVTGSDALATAGSGDILSGMIAALLIQGVEPVMAAALGAYLHGLCGETAGQQLGNASVIASDIIDAIQRVLRGLS